MVERTLREAGVCVRQTFKGPPLKVSPSSWVPPVKVP